MQLTAMNQTNPRANFAGSPFDVFDSVSVLVPNGQRPAFDFAVKTSTVMGGGHVDVNVRAERHRGPVDAQLGYQELTVEMEGLEPFVTSMTTALRQALDASGLEHS